jgi:hypothetical protein
MSRGKNLSLEEARKSGTLNRFAKEHPSEADRDRFLALLDAMSKGSLEGEETSQPDHPANSGGTRTRRGTWRDACATQAHAFLGSNVSR